MSKEWIQFHLQNLNRFDDCNEIVNRKTGKDIKDIKEVEKLLTHLKRLCDPCGLETLKEIANTKMPANVTRSEKSKVFPLVKNTRNIFVRENTPQLVCTDEHLLNNEVFACYLKTDQSSSLENSSNDQSENELLVIPRENKIQQITVTKKETDLERDSPEVKGLLRLILVLGNQQGIADIRSSLQQLDKHNSNLTLNDLTESQQSDTKVKEIELPLQITDDQTGPLIDTDLSPNKNNDQTDQLSGIDLPRNRDTSSNAFENVASRKNPFLKLKMPLSNVFPRIETQGTSKQKQNEETKKEIDIDLERERPEVMSLLKTLLVLGNPEGMIHLRSSLPRSDTNRCKISKKK
ncbi:hypothetical protein TNCT_465461 [Trichonephila clavata]|uniref:Uncharacterized protein n=1 Tax=Trichonephila clavata TaxID=2740835 RepID=A0A8X6L8F3_TRICU|nr:hypothetical protein TNCT_465461 [Trichonephila clavata]